MTTPSQRSAPAAARRPRVRALAAGLAAVCLGGTLAGCGPVDPLFRNDRRVEIVEPRSQQEVTLPFTLRWTVEDFRPTGPDGGRDPGAGYFAVFVDTAPVPPGETLAWVARDDRACRAVPGCPDQAYLADRRVFTTTEPQLTIDSLTDPDAPGEQARRHEATVVLLDGSGRRIGESAWHVDFRLEPRR